MEKNIEKIKCMSCQKQDTVEINVILKEQIAECPLCGKFIQMFRENSILYLGGR